MKRMKRINKKIILWILILKVLFFNFLLNLIMNHLIKFHILSRLHLKIQQLDLSTKK
jgi:hypothetical protein